MLFDHNMSSLCAMFVGLRNMKHVHVMLSLPSCCSITSACKPTNTRIEGFVAISWEKGLIENAL